MLSHPIVWVHGARALRDGHRRGSAVRERGWGGGWEGSAKDLKLGSPGEGGRTGFDVDANK